MRYLGIDLGDKRTGVAVSDSLTRLTSPLVVLDVPIAQRDGEALLDAISRVVHEQIGPAGSKGELVVGLPLNMDGTEGPRARLTRAFGQRLAARTGLPVVFQDERLSSADAEWALAGSGMSHDQKKKRRDALAAAAILRSFIADLPAQGPLRS